MKLLKTKKAAALLSIISNTLLIIFKFVVGIISGSVSIISEAVHSFTDLLASFLAFYSIRESSKPADGDHQYGHDKFEDLSGGIEGSLIIFAAAYIIYEALNKIIYHTYHHIDTSTGIYVMLFSVVINLLVSSYIFKIARNTDSIALEADAQHLRSDVWSSLGVLFGLILIRVTGLYILDPIIAILVALLITKAGYSLSKTAVRNLLDVSLPEEEKRIILSTVENYINNTIIEVKGFKTRKAGAKKVIEFTLTIPTHLTIKEGHDICDGIEHELEKKMQNVDVTIHLEPCNGTCHNCILYHKESSICYNK